MARPKKPTLTDEDIYKAAIVTPEMAAQYLGPGISAQSARLLARDGKIGCSIPNTRRVYIQPGKLIAFKHGPADEDAHYRALARALVDEGVSEIASKVAVAMLKVLESENKLCHD